MTPSLMSVARACALLKRMGEPTTGRVQRRKGKRVEQVEFTLTPSDEQKTAIGLAVAALEAYERIRELAEKYRDSDDDRVGMQGHMIADDIDHRLRGAP